MAYWNDLVLKSSYSAYQKETPRSQALSAQYPEYEQSTPQNVSPSPYSLAQQGYKTNTLIYACIERRMKAVSAAPMWMYDVSNSKKLRITGTPEFNILEHPNERISQRQFWQITSMYQDIGGTALWEIERNNTGEPIALWPMRPDWCSYLRGNGRPIRAVRYQPMGLPPQDIDINNVLMFQYFDPLNPLIKGYSPTMAALRDIAVDNGMNSFLYGFIMNGARFSGLLTTVQDLDDIEAERIRERWKIQHGGVENWNEIAVLGNGATYQNTSMDLNEMAFPELDGRIEARICMAFEMPPILLGAKIGLKSLTFTNYREARSSWYEEWVTPQWEFYAEQYQAQMFRSVENGLTVYDEGVLCEFMTKKVSAMQVNRDLAFRRAISAARANVFTRDQALEEMDMPPVDFKPVYIGPSMKTDSPITIAQGANDDSVANEETSDVVPDTNNAATGAEQILEQKQFRAFANKRVKEGKIDELNDFIWVHNSPETVNNLLAQYESLRD